MGQNPLHSPDDITPKSPSRPIGGEGTGEGGLQQPPSTPFNLQGGGTAAPNQSNAASPMSLATQNAQQQGAPTLNNLLQQANQINTQMQAAKQQLQTPGLQFKPSTADILNQHLNRIGGNLAAIGSRLNQQLTPNQPGSVSSGAQYFLNYLTGGQRQLSEITKSISNPPGGTLTVQDMLAVQVKMTGVQQQMEFFSVLLGKVVDNIKTLMNIQS